MKVRVVDSGKGDSATHMARDKQLLESIGEGEIILHLYEWSGEYPMTYGYFMRPEKFLVDNREKLGMDAAIRPTGGGFVFHHGDYAFSLLMSSSHPRYSSAILENYHTVNSMILNVLNKIFSIQAVLAESESCSSHNTQSSNFCMAKLSKYDVAVGGRKIGGAAQRTVKQGFLHQGSIFLSGSSADFYTRFLLPHAIPLIVPEIDKRSYFPLGINVASSVLQEAREDIKHNLIREFASEGI
ncbi:biotin/lipoate A/B ligase family protein [Chlamydia ibidis]|uniref:Biotin/lipoate A/B ligase family protein n=2 Tax=Chlamydia ibidis TaxID=1405396 RepID=S7KDU3_9CHLA|nr:biotin/lipoate A/B ligase [Chlamydia ibidis]EPP34366.1 biotin/lipoate A/B ligase family protein [Chlamydia ibidis]EQM63175.1 biotin/lipoate A/B ligase family protein [Chlamydia ibidis 10-1398/6]